MIVCFSGCENSSNTSSTSQQTVTDGSKKAWYVGYWSSKEGDYLYISDNPDGPKAVFVYVVSNKNSSYYKRGVFHEAYETDGKTRLSVFDDGYDAGYFNFDSNCNSIFSPDDIIYHKDPSAINKINKLIKKAEKKAEAQDLKRAKKAKSFVKDNPWLVRSWKCEDCEIEIKKDGTVWIKDKFSPNGREGELAFDSYSIDIFDSGYCLGSIDVKGKTVRIGQ